MFISVKNIGYNFSFMFVYVLHISVTIFFIYVPIHILNERFYSLQVIQIFVFVSVLQFYIQIFVIVYSNIFRLCTAVLHSKYLSVLQFFYFCSYSNIYCINGFAFDSG